MAAPTEEILLSSWTVGLTITCLQERVYQALYFSRACEVLRCLFAEVETSLGASFLRDFFSLLKMNYIAEEARSLRGEHTQRIWELLNMQRGTILISPWNSTGKTAHRQFFSHPIHSISRTQKDFCSFQSMDCLPFSQGLLPRFLAAGPISILLCFLAIGYSLWDSQVPSWNPIFSSLISK